jgi:hypothetical protein
MLTGYEDMSMETLCTVGKELVAELMTRMITIVNNYNYPIAQKTCLINKSKYF